MNYIEETNQAVIRLKQLLTDMYRSAADLDILIQGIENHTHPEFRISKKELLRYLIATEDRRHLVKTAKGYKDIGERDTEILVKLISNLKVEED